MDFIHNDGTSGRAAPARQVYAPRVQVLLIKKLTGAGIIRAAAKHNLRKLAAELGADSHIDAARVCLNRVLRGPDCADAVAAQATALMAEVGARLKRKDAVRALEILVTLPPASGIDEAAFFESAVTWAEYYYRVPVLSGVVHNDESAPHLHLLLLPLVNGHMRGSALAGKYALAQDDFHAKVGRRYGLTRQALQKRHSAAIKQQAMDLAFDVLDVNSGLESRVIHALLAPHAKNPEPLLLALGLEMPVPKAKGGSFAAIMTQPCKPEKPIGFADINAPEKNDQSLCSVGFASSASSISPSAVPQPAAPLVAIEQPIDAGQDALVEPPHHHDQQAALPAAPTPQPVTRAPIRIDIRADSLATVASDELPERAAFPVTVQPESDCGKDAEILCALDPGAAGGADSPAAIDADQGDEPDEAWVRERDHEQPSEYWDGDTGQMITPHPKPASAKSRADALVAAVQTSDERGHSHNLDVELWWAG
jgi:hypothetical protein